MILAETLDYLSLFLGKKVRVFLVCEYSNHDLTNFYSKLCRTEVVICIPQLEMAIDLQAL